MKDLTQFVSFVAPSVRQASTRSAKVFHSNYASALSPVRNINGDNCAIYRDTSMALRAEIVDASVASSMMGQQEPSGVYEAVVPQTETLLGMGLIVGLCVVVYWVWENQVVPVSRQKLAISKSRGEVKEYLDELKSSAPPSKIESSAQLLSSESISFEAMPPVHPVGEPLLQPANATIDFEDTRETSIGNQLSSPSPATTPDRAFERWLFTDWLQDNKSEKKGGRQKEPALPILKDARWNSGDNPIVVGAFLMLVGLVFTALTERLASFG